MMLTEVTVVIILWYMQVKIILIYASFIICIKTYSAPNYLFVKWGEGAERGVWHMQ